MNRIICLLIIFLITFLSACNEEKLIWPDDEMCDVIPQPDSSKGNIIINNKQSFYLTIYDISSKQYKDYIEKCKEKGFVIDIEVSANTLSAYNESGYRLVITYYELTEHMGINLDAPKIFTEVNWNEKNIMGMLPLPKSNLGCIEFDETDKFVVFIINISKNDYTEYVNACSECGFNHKCTEGDNYYYALNDKNYYLALRYEGYNTMQISIKAPENNS